MMQENASPTYEVECMEDLLRFHLCQLNMIIKLTNDCFVCLRSFLQTVVQQRRRTGKWGSNCNLQTGLARRFFNISKNLYAEMRA